MMVAVPTPFPSKDLSCQRSVPTVPFSFQSPDRCRNPPRGRCVEDPARRESRSSSLPEQPFQRQAIPEPLNTRRAPTRSRARRTQEGRKPARQRRNARRSQTRPGNHERRITRDAPADAETLAASPDTHRESSPSHEPAPAKGRGSCSMPRYWDFAAGHALPLGHVGVVDPLVVAGLACRIHDAHQSPAPAFRPSLSATPARNTARLGGEISRRAPVRKSRPAPAALVETANAPKCANPDLLASQEPAEMHPNTASTAARASRPVKPASDATCAARPSAFRASGPSPPGPARRAPAAIRGRARALRSPRRPCRR